MPLATSRRRRWRREDGILFSPWGLQAARHAATAAAGAASSSGTAAPAAAGGSGGGAPGEVEGPERLGKVVAASFRKDPRSTAGAIMKHLTELDRVHLLVALQQSTKRELLERKETAYVEDLVKQKRDSEHHVGLTRSQIANAVTYQRMLQKFSSYSVEPPSLGQLVAVATASGLPFVGFGFTDNAIMLVAGEQIDVLFGASMGISTLASAALGNLVADVVGVSVTHQIQAVAKNIKWAQPPHLSVLQQNLSRVKVAKLGGAVLGVTLGCIMGMIPLAFMDTESHHHDCRHEQPQQQAGDAAAGGAAGQQQPAPPPPQQQQPAAGAGPAAAGAKGAP